MIDKSYLHSILKRFERYISDGEWRVLNRLIKLLATNFPGPSLAPAQAPVITQLSPLSRGLKPLTLGQSKHQAK